MHIYARKLSHHWLRKWLVICLVLNHYLNQCWHIFNRNVVRLRELNPTGNKSNIASDNGLVTSGNKPPPETSFDQGPWNHMTSPDHDELMFSCIYIDVFISCSSRPPILVLLECCMPFNQRTRRSWKLWSNFWGWKSASRTPSCLCLKWVTYLIHHLLRDVAVILEIWFSNLLRIIYALGTCYESALRLIPKNLTKRSQHWSR